MRKLEIDIDEKVYNEALKIFKSKENLEQYISNALMRYKTLNDAMNNSTKLIKEFKNVLEFVISNHWVNQEISTIDRLCAQHPLLVDNTQIALKCTVLSLGKTKVDFYTFTPYLKESNKDITTITVEVNQSAIEVVTVKNIHLLQVDRTFKLAFNTFDGSESFDLEGVRYQLYLSLSYLFRVEFNAI